MLEQNLQSLLKFSILVIIITSIKSQNNDYKNLTSRLYFNTEEDPRKTTHITAPPTPVPIIDYDEYFDDNALRRMFVEHFKNYNVNSEGKANETKPQEKGDKVLSRKLREIRVTRNEENSQELQCYSCHSKDNSPTDKCYNSIGLNVETCLGGAICLTEIHPSYIWRGCVKPDHMNRTFVCKCHLCNDKTVFDRSYYEYLSIIDWEFDNHRLEKQEISDDPLFCKSCMTQGLSKHSDRICKLGTEVDYVTCRRNQFCYTNINDITNEVFRGCIDPPAYNSIYFYCKLSRCNDYRYPKYYIKARRDTVQMRTFAEPKIMVMVPKNEKHKSYGCKNATNSLQFIINLCFVFLIKLLVSV